MEAGSQQAPWEGEPAATHPDDDGDAAGATVVDEFAERPELFVGAAFAGGLAIALILKRFDS
jgi:hypothetical protein